MSFDSLFRHRLYKQASKICLLCNQASYDFSRKRYLFDLMADEKKLKTILLPEHGLFSDLQDQESVDDVYYRDIKCHSLYDKSKNQTTAQNFMLEGVDLLIIDVFDVGARYFTYSTHMFGLFKLLDGQFSTLPVIVIDRPNPVGDKVEGTIINEKYSSFLGVSGLIHRHGMSVGKLCSWYIMHQKLTVDLNIIPYNVSNFQFIMPSPNLPSERSLAVYPGQCLWEATSWSEGRGTTRPFEIFGHPDFTFAKAEKVELCFNKKFRDKAFLRTLKFIPAYHKHKNCTCIGWQIFIIDPNNYHCIFGSLYIMRLIFAMECNMDFWRPGTYEFDSEYNAAQLLIGDDDLIAFIEGKRTEKEIFEKLQYNEDNWRMSNF